MSTAAQAKLTGIVLQAGGAAWLVYQAWRTSRNLRRFNAKLTYEEFGGTVGQLAAELSGQFRQQLIGFGFVAAGSVLQIYGALP